MSVAHPLFPFPKRQLIDKAAGQYVVPRPLVGSPIKSCVVKVETTVCVPRPIIHRFRPCIVDCVEQPMAGCFLELDHERVESSVSTSSLGANGSKAGEP